MKLNKKNIILVTSLGVLSLPISVLAISLETPFVGKFCDPFDIVSYQMAGVAFRIISFSFAVLAMVSLVAFIIFLIKTKKTEKNPQLPDYPVEIKKLKSWRKVFLIITIVSVISSPLFYLAWYNAQDPYRSYVQELRDEGCTNF